MDRIRNIYIRGRFLPQCQGCKKLVLERNGYDGVWNCCYYYSCAYQLAHSDRCIGTDHHEEFVDSMSKENTGVGHA